MLRPSREPRRRRASSSSIREGGIASAFDDLPSGSGGLGLEPPPGVHGRTRDEAEAPRRAGVHVDLAPVLDCADRSGAPFPRPELGVGPSRAVTRAGTAAWAKPFGPGTAAVSSDESPSHVGKDQATRARGVQGGPFGTAAVRDGPPHLPNGLKARGTSSRGIYRLLRKTGFEGVAITDSVSVFGASGPFRPEAFEPAPTRLLTNGPDARRAIRALVPWARRGLLRRACRAGAGAARTHWVLAPVTLLDSPTSMRADAGAGPIRQGRSSSAQRDRAILVRRRPRSHWRRSRSCSSPSSRVGFGFAGSADRVAGGAGRRGGRRLERRRAERALSQRARKLPPPCKPFQAGGTPMADSAGAQLALRGLKQSADEDVGRPRAASTTCSAPWLRLSPGTDVVTGAGWSEGLSRRVSARC